VDSDAPLSDTTVTRLLAVGEPQLVLRGETIHTPRGPRQPRGGWRAGAGPPTGHGGWVCRPRAPSRNLQLEPVPNADAPLEPGHVRVAMRSIATNFRDVMITLGMFTHDALIGW